MQRNTVKTTINGKKVELGLNNGNVATPKIEVLGVVEESSDSVEIQKVHDKVEKIQSKIPEDMDVIDYIEDLQDKTEGKEWWKSKTIWVNVSALIMMALSLFGFNLYVDPEVLMLIASILVPMINLWLRNKTDKAIKQSGSEKIEKKK
jgi:hypothetical protein